MAKLGIVIDKLKDITETAAVIWHRSGEDFHRTMSTVAIENGLLFITDLSDFCIASMPQLVNITGLTTCLPPYGVRL
ncbi:MAG: hypothetical protein R3C26_16965 [Calditrichia bacterium]